MVDGGATGLLSFGLCGGLDPALPPGALLIPAAVLADAVRYPASPTVAAPFGSIGPHLLLGETRIAATASDKRRLHATTGAAAIDLETGAVARVATAAGLPFAVVRAICDTAGEDLPPAALVALNGVGGIGVLRVLASLAAHPTQLPALLMLGRHAAAARRALRRAVARAADVR